jgi:branched-chain amino acid transport system ATP-binding protein/urea transport system ATP-binding protein
MLKLEELRAGYGRTVVLNGLGFEVETGEIVAVLGRNGVGKSTMLKALIGTVPVASGTILFDGEDVSRLPAYARARRGMAFVPQGREIFPALTVTENLLVAAYGSRRPGSNERLDELFDEYPMLAEKRTARAGSLSGGQQQMLALARALMTSPRLLLLDEPSEGIQPSIVDQIAETVRRINHEGGISVVLVEQNLDFAADVADRAYVMDKGRIVRDLPATEVVRDRDLQREYLGV